MSKVKQPGTIPQAFHIVLNQSFPEKGLNINSKREAVLEQSQSAAIASSHNPLTTSLGNNRLLAIHISIAIGILT